MRVVCVRITVLAIVPAMPSCHTLKYSTGVSGSPAQRPCTPDHACHTLKYSTGVSGCRLEGARIVLDPCHTLKYSTGVSGSLQPVYHSTPRSLPHPQVLDWCVRSNTPTTTRRAWCLPHPQVLDWCVRCRIPAHLSKGQLPDLPHPQVLDWCVRAVAVGVARVGVAPATPSSTRLVCPVLSV